MILNNLEIDNLKRSNSNGLEVLTNKIYKQVCLFQKAVYICTIKNETKWHHTTETT